ncbi:unnamed protein product, partial [Allacma fusca]
DTVQVALQGQQIDVYKKALESFASTVTKIFNLKAP